MPAPTPTPTPTPVPTSEPTPTPTPTPEQTPIATTTPVTLTPTPIATTTLPVHIPQIQSIYTYNQGEDIGTETLPEAAGGAGGFTYSLTPSLPDGLSFDSTTRALTGTPAEFGKHSMTYTATDANGLTISWYELQYRKQGEQAWTVFNDYVLESPGLTLSSLEPGETYEFQVRAGANKEGVGPWSDTGSGRANRSPTAPSAPFNDGTFPVGSIADYKEAGQGALGEFFADADSDDLTYSASAQHPTLLGVRLSGGAGQAHLEVTLLNSGTSKVTLVATDPYGGQISRSVTLTATPRNVAGASRSTPPQARLWAPR